MPKITMIAGTLSPFFSNFNDGIWEGLILNCSCQWEESIGVYGEASIDLCRSDEDRKSVVFCYFTPPVKDFSVFFRHLAVTFCWNLFLTMRGIQWSWWHDQRWPEMARWRLQTWRTFLVFAPFFFRGSLLSYFRMMEGLSSNGSWSSCVRAVRWVYWCNIPCLVHPWTETKCYIVINLEDHNSIKWKATIKPSFRLGYYLLIGSLIRASLELVWMSSSQTNI